jgi:hypothetical protein
VLLACSVLALYHEAAVAHVVDAKGTSLHAPRTDCHETTRSSTIDTHIHELPGHEHPDIGACLSAAFAHQAATLGDRLAFVTTTAQLDTIATPITAAPGAGARLLHIAPKTSPPRA